jgi:hypothetical protein
MLAVVKNRLGTHRYVEGDSGGSSSLIDTGVEIDDDVNSSNEDFCCNKDDDCFCRIVSVGD